MKRRLKNLFDRLQRFLKTDRAILILSISIALFFWLFTKMSKDYETDRLVYFNFELPEGKTFLNTPPKYIKTQIKGGGWNLFFNYLRGGLPDVDFPLEKENVQNISSTSLINKISTTIGTKYEVLNVESDIISIKLDDEHVKKVPVQLNIDLQIENGFMQADSLQVTPKEFTISGPQTVVDNITTYPTEKVVIDEIGGSFSQKIKAKKPANPQLKISPQEVVITNTVEKSTEGQLVVPIRILNAPDSSISILPRNVFIKYRAPLSIFGEITKDDFTVIARLDANNMASANNTLPLEIIRQPSFTKVISMSPPAIEYYFVKEVVE
jgi:hypothetical protein